MTFEIDDNAIRLDDLLRMATSESTALPSAIVAFLAQDDPPLAGSPAGAIDPPTLMAQLRWARSRRRKDDRRENSRKVWGQFLNQPGLEPPPRFQLPALLEALYERGSEASRALLIEIVTTAPLKLGLWGGIKRVYKKSEAAMDALVYGAIAARIDIEAIQPSFGCEVSTGTLLYLRNRSWRFLKTLAKATPVLFAQFAVEMLRHYGPHTVMIRTWIPLHVFFGKKARDRFSGRWYTASRLPENVVKDRAFADAWKLSPDPLMILLETCRNDMVATFAIQSLRQDFAETLRTVTPAWLERLSHGSLASVHDFVVETLEASPEFHQAKLKGVGLHDAVISLLRSPSKRARTYAIAYARSNASDLSSELLASLLDDVDGACAADTKAFAAELLSTRDPRVLGLTFVGDLIRFAETRRWAQKVLEERFERSEVTREFLTSLLFSACEPKVEWAAWYIEKRYPDNEMGTAFWTAILDDPKSEVDPRSAVISVAIKALKRFPITSVDPAWLVGKLLAGEKIAKAMAAWMSEATVLPGLDVERVKGLVFDATRRGMALDILSNTKIVRPSDLGVGWLIALARRPEPELSSFAGRYLLEHMKPSDFAGPSGASAESGTAAVLAKGGAAAGITRLFAMAIGEGEPETLRAFAQRYLRCHHPIVGPKQPETLVYSLKPQLDRDDFKAEMLWPALLDPRMDVRRFALAIAQSDLRHWGYLARVYELTESEAKEVRTFAYDALLKAGDAGADLACTLTPDEIDAEPVLGMIESRRRSTRDVGMHLLARDYARLGGPERVAWLMQSADREVRAFAVEMLWMRHRPRSLPAGWRPRGTSAGGEKMAEIPASSPALLDDVEMLRSLLRRVLFGLPPGRLAEPTEGSRRRRVAAGVVKRHMIELVRELALRDVAFAHVSAPVLEEFTASLATGEWQACLAAWMAVRRAHPGLADRSGPGDHGDPGDIGRQGGLVALSAKGSEADR